MSVKSYRDLIVWQKSIDFAAAIYKTSALFPLEEKFGLTSQIRRSAVSVAANIAEGYGRNSKGDFTRFLRISQGSLKEAETHLLLAVRLEFIQMSQIEADMVLAEEIGKMLRTLISKVGREV